MDRQLILKFLFLAILILVPISCEDIQEEYPDEPVVDYQGFSLFITTDELGNKTLVGRLNFEFTDGDGNLGFQDKEENSDPELPDSLKYNFYLQLYDISGFEVAEVPESEGGFLKYRIPYLDKQPLSGTIDLDISFPVIVYDTIFYTFWIYDRDFNRSNTDTTEIMILSNIEIDTIQGQ